MTNRIKFVLIFLPMMLFNHIDAQSFNNNLFNTCSQNDPNLEDCIKNILADVIAMLKEGIPDLQIGACEPLAIGNLVISKSEADYYEIEGLFKDVKLHGFTELEVDAVEANADLTEFKIMVHADKIKMTANYELDGHIFEAPVSGANVFIARSVNLDALITIRGEKVTKPFWNNISHFQIQDVQFAVNVENAKLKFNALYGGDYDVNQLLNQHFYLVNPEINQHFQNEMANMVQIIASRFFDKYSFDELFPM